MLPLAHVHHTEGSVILKHVEISISSSTPTGPGRRKCLTFLWKCVPKMPRQFSIIVWAISEQWHTYSCRSQGIRGELVVVGPFYLATSQRLAQSFVPLWVQWGGSTRRRQRRHRRWVEAQRCPWSRSRSWWAWSHCRWAVCPPLGVWCTSSASALAAWH